MLVKTQMPAPEGLIVYPLFMPLVILLSLHWLLRTGREDRSGVQTDSLFKSWPEVAHGLYLLEPLGDVKGSGLPRFPNWSHRRQHPSAFGRLPHW